MFRRKIWVSLICPCYSASEYVFFDAVCGLFTNRNLMHVYSIHQFFKGPIVCEIDTKDEDASNYLEQHVRNTVLKSYVVECKADYDLLFREMKQKRKWKINIQLIHDGVYKPFRRMYSDRMINKLKQEHGVVGFLDEVFEAPDAVMQALQSTSNIQQVLIGGAKTYESMNRKNLTAYLNKKEDGSGNRAFCIFAKDGRKMYKVRFSLLE